MEINWALHSLQPEPSPMHVATSHAHVARGCGSCLITHLNKPHSLINK